MGTGAGADASAAPGQRWLTGGVWLIAMSAFCADLGYQGVLAVFPLFLVLDLRASAAAYGLATALAYGPGAVAGYLGGRAGDRTGRKRVAMWGNAFLPLMALAGLASGAAAAVALFASGWWARNFRSAPRRAMLVEIVAPEHRSTAFGFLHALDVGGGALAALYAFALVAAAAPYRTVLLVAALPLVASTVVLGFVRAGARPVRQEPGAPGSALSSPPRPHAPEAPSALPAAEPGSAPRPAAEPQAAAGPAVPTAASPAPPRDLSLYRGVLAAAALYGFASYSAGFPVLTIAQGTGSPALGVLSYVVFLGVSALTGLVVGGRRWDPGLALPLLGYLAAAVGSAGIAAAYAWELGVAGLFPAMAVLGLALGVIETLEPSLIARLTPAALTGGGMGSLTASRSIGLFVANLALGLLYTASPVYSYGYATLMALAASAVLLLAAGAARRRSARIA